MKQICYMVLLQMGSGKGVPNGQKSRPPRDNRWSQGEITNITCFETAQTCSQGVADDWGVIGRLGGENVRGISIRTATSFCLGVAMEQVGGGEEGELCKKSVGGWKQYVTKRGIIFPLRGDYLFFGRLYAVVELFFSPWV